MPIDPRVPPATVHALSLTSTQADNQIRQVNQRLNFIYPEKAKFMALMNKLTNLATGGRADGRARKYEWGQQADAPRRVTVDGTTAANGTTVAAAGTAIHIAEATAVVPHEVLHDERTGEDLWIVSNTSGALVVGTRGNYGGGTPDTIPAGTQLLIGAAAKEEHADASNAKMITPEFLYNVYQTHERDIERSTLAAAIEYYLFQGGRLENHDAMNMMADFKLGLEKIALFGQRAETTGPSARNLFKAGGVRYWAEAHDNVYSVNGTFTYQKFQDIMGQHARVAGGGLYWAFCAERVASILQRMALPYERTAFMSGTTKVFGLDHMKYKGTGWRLEVYQHELFEESDTLGKQMYLVQAGNVIPHFLRGLGPQVHKGIKSPKNDGTHGYKDQMTGSMTLEVRIPEANGIIDDIAA